MFHLKQEHLDILEVLRSHPDGIRTIHIAETMKKKGKTDWVNNRLNTLSYSGFVSKKDRGLWQVTEKGHKILAEARRQPPPTPAAP